MNAAAAGAPSSPLFPCLQCSSAQAGNTFDLSSVRRCLHPSSSLCRRCRCLTVAAGHRRGMPPAHVCSWPFRWPGTAMDKPGRPLSAAASSRWPSPADHNPALLHVCVEEDAKDRGHELEKMEDLSMKQ